MIEISLLQVFTRNTQAILVFFCNTKITARLCLSVLQQTPARIPASHRSGAKETRQSCELAYELGRLPWRSFAVYLLNLIRVLRMWLLQEGFFFIYFLFLSLPRVYDLRCIADRGEFIRMLNSKSRTSNQPWCFFFPPFLSLFSPSGNEFSLACSGL